MPVRFDMPGASAVLRGDPLTDGSGVATCHILAAHGPPGEYELTVGVDSEAAHAALTGAFPSDSRADAHGDAVSGLFTPLATHRVHLVAGAHAISVCATFGERNEINAAQVTAGFTRRIERDGFRTDECDPNVDVVVTGELSLTASGQPDSWVANVTLSATAFDQRTASEIGSVCIRTEEPANVENGEAGRREAEVLALKEAGRLLAVYFGPRMLTSGR